MVYVNYGSKDAANFLEHFLLLLQTEVFQLIL